MATITYIPEKTQSRTAMGKVMRYCSREDKTKIEQDGRQYQLISGKNCCGETAYKEFMATKQQYGKDHGMFFYQYVQSFSPEENITPQQAHEVGCKFAEYFKGYEVLIATHTDAAHIHTHLIINSVNHENGKKLQMARGSIHKLRDFSDELCRQYNLSIVQPKEQESKGINTREYRAAKRGDSWKFTLINVVDRAMKISRSKAEFIAYMKKMGYGVNWSDNRKHITYTTPEGYKCRDNKMHDDKYLKHNMEVYYEYGNVKGAEQARKSDRGLSGKRQGSDIRYPAGNAGKAVVDVVGDRAGYGSNATGNGAAYDRETVYGHSVPADDEIAQQTNRNDKSFGRTTRGTVRGYDDRAEISGSQRYSGSPARYIRAVEENGEAPDRTGFIRNESPGEVGGDRSVGASDIIRIAQDIQHLVNPRNPKKEQEERERELAQRRQAQKKRKSREWEMER